MSKITAPTKSTKQVADFRGESSRSQRRENLLRPQHPFICFYKRLVFVKYISLFTIRRAKQAVLGHYFLPVSPASFVLWTTNRIRMPPTSPLIVVSSFLLGLLALTFTSASEEQAHPDPDDVWSTWMIPEIQNDWLQCWDRDHSQPLMYGPETWMMLREEYHSVMESSLDSNAPPEYYDGFSVSIETKFNPETGRRSNFAVADIPEGTLVWKSTYTAAFRDGDSYRHFLRRMSPTMACDVISWAYTRRDLDGLPTACVDLDPGSFTNGAETEEDLNLALRDGHPSDTGCDLEFYATRDIREGEELAVDYFSFAMGDHGWAEMGLQSEEDLEYHEEYGEEEAYGGEEYYDEEEETETEF